MVTRRQARRWLCWTCVGIGGASVVLMLFTLFGEIEWTTRAQRVTVRSAAIDSFWGSNGQARTPGVAVSAVYAWSFTIMPRYEPYSHLVVPLWMPVALGLFAAYRLLPETGKAGTCPACSHDLSGAPRVEVHREHVRCPECGTISVRETAPMPLPDRRAAGMP